MYLTLWTLRVSPLYVYRHFSDGFVRAGTLREPEKVATLRRVRTLDHANPRKGLRGNPAGTLKVATLPRVQSLDHTNPRRGLRGAPKSCSFTSGSVAGPRQSMVRAARDAEKLEKVATPIHGKGCAGRRIVRKKLQLYRALAHSTTPIHMVRVARDPEQLEKSCNFTSRSVARPRQSMGGVARDAEKLQLYLAFARSTTPIHGKGCASRRKIGKNCNFTSRSRARPCQSMVRVARHAEKLEKIAIVPRVRALDHSNRLRVAPKKWKKLQFYTAFARSTTPIHGNGCARSGQVAILPRVRALDHANPW